MSATSTVTPSPSSVRLLHPAARRTAARSADISPRRRPGRTCSPRCGGHGAWSRIAASITDWAARAALQPREILAGVMRRARQRRGRHHQEALGVGDRLQRLELVRRHEAFDLVMFARRLQILPDGEEIDVGRAQVVHHLQHFVALLAEAHHDAGLGEHRGIELLHPLQQPQRMEIARARPHREIKRRHGFEIVVEHVGPGRDHDLQRAVLAQEIGRQHFDGGCRARACGWRGWCRRNAARRRRRDRRGRPR